MAGTTVESSLPEEEIPPIDDVELPPDDAVAAETAVEARAREMGWKPLAEYRGPPGRWQPAASFIRRGEEELPIVRDRARRLEEKVGKLEGEISGLRSSSEEQLKIIKDLRDLGQRQNKAGYDRAMAEIKSKQRQAVEVGDTKAYDQLVEQQEALLESRPAAAPATTVTPPAEVTVPAVPPISEATKAFIGANPWFRNDQFLNRKMIDAHIDVIQEGQIADEAEQYAEAKQRLVDAYPERFGTMPAHREPAPAPRRRAAAVAQPTAEAPALRPGATPTTINSITDPAERAQCRDAFNRMKRQIPDYTEKEYMELYADPHGDVLTLQSAQRSKPNGR